MESNKTSQSDVPDPDPNPIRPPMDVSTPSTSPSTNNELKEEDTTLVIFVDENGTFLGVSSESGKERKYNLVSSSDFTIASDIDLQPHEDSTLAINQAISGVSSRELKKQMKITRNMMSPDHFALIQEKAVLGSDHQHESVYHAINSNLLQSSNSSSSGSSGSNSDSWDSSYSSEEDMDYNLYRNEGGRGFVVSSKFEGSGSPKDLVNVHVAKFKSTFAPDGFHTYHTWDGGFSHSSASTNSSYESSSSSYDIDYTINEDSAMTITSNVFSCNACDTPIEKDYVLCGGCDMATYCDEKCQEKDWRSHHKDHCEVIKNATLNISCNGNKYGSTENSATRRVPKSKKKYLEERSTKKGTKYLNYEDAMENKEKKEEANEEAAYYDGVDESDESGDDDQPEYVTVRDYENEATPRSLQSLIQGHLEFYIGNKTTFRSKGGSKSRVVGKKPRAMQGSKSVRSSGRSSSSKMSGRSRKSSSTAPAQPETAKKRGMFSRVKKGASSLKMAAGKKIFNKGTVKTTITAEGDGAEKGKKQSFFSKRKSQVKRGLTAAKLKASEMMKQKRVQAERKLGLTKDTPEEKEMKREIQDRKKLLQNERMKSWERDRTMSKLKKAELRSEKAEFRSENEMERAKALRANYEASIRKPEWKDMTNEEFREFFLSSGEELDRKRRAIMDGDSKNKTKLLEENRKERNKRFDEFEAELKARGMMPSQNSTSLELQISDTQAQILSEIGFTVGPRMGGGAGRGSRGGARASVSLSAPRMGPSRSFGGSRVYSGVPGRVSRPVVLSRGGRPRPIGRARTYTSVPRPIARRARAYNDFLRRYPNLRRSGRPHHVWRTYNRFWSPFSVLYPLSTWYDRYPLPLISAPLWSNEMAMSMEIAAIEARYPDMIRMGYKILPDYETGRFIWVATSPDLYDRALRFDGPLNARTGLGLGLDLNLGLGF